MAAEHRRWLDADVALSWFDSSATGIKPAYVNPAFDALFRPSRSETDRAKREKILQECQAFLYEEAPCCFLVRQGRIYGFKKDLQGFKPRTDTAIFFDEMRWAYFKDRDSPVPARLPRDAPAVLRFVAVDFRPVYAPLRDVFFDAVAALLEDRVRQPELAAASV